MPDRPHLSKRERESMYGEALRLSPQETADLLGIGVETVRKYQSDARRKLGGRTKREAVRRFLELYNDPPEHYTAFQGIVGDYGTMPIPEPVDRDGSHVSDVSVDRIRVPDVRGDPSIWQELADVLSGVRPGALSIPTRNLIMLASAVAGGMIFFALSIGVALVAPFAKIIRALFS